MFAYKLLTEVEKKVTLKYKNSLSTDNQLKMNI